MIHSTERYQEAREAILVAFPRAVGRAPNLSEEQIIAANAGLESSFCRGSYCRKDHATGQNIECSGVIFNCGAVQGEPGFLATDTSPSKVTADNPHGYYDHHYKVYPDLASGLEDMIRQFVVRRPSSWAHAMKGDIDAWAEGAHAAYLPGGKVQTDPQTGVPGYFEQSPPARAEGVYQRAVEYAEANGEPVAVGRGGPVETGIAAQVAGGVSRTMIVRALAALVGLRVAARLLGWF